MSGDVQPRKRKDKKRKKDELGVEEPRGTAADLGEGDVFMHSQHDHGTGGHWCAKIIFFSLLAVLIALIGLIILENRGLSELEANSVETRYSGVLEGWLEDAPDDDHHDEHTLELKHHDEDDDHDDVDDHDVGVDHGLEDEHDDDDEHGDEPEDDDEIDDEDENDDDEDENDVDEDENDDEEHSNEDDDEELEQDVEPAEDEDEDERPRNSKYYDDDDEDEFGNDDEQHGDDDNEDEQEDEGNDNDNVEQDEDETSMNKFDDFDQDVDDDDEGQGVEKYDGGNDDNSEENDEANDDEDEEEHEDGEEDTEIEVEKIEKEASENEEPISLELPVLPEDDDDDKEPVTDEDKKEDEGEDDETAEDDDDDDEDFSDGQLPLLVEHYTAPSGQPFQEVEEAVSSEKPPDTLEEEEEYEKQQEELRREQEQASHKDGGNSLEDEWPGEPSDPYWRRELDAIERELRQGEGEAVWAAVAERAVAPQLRDSARARYLAAAALDRAAETLRDNRLLSRAIAAYIHLLKMNEGLSDKKLLEVTDRTLDRIQFRGNYLNAEPVYRLLIRRFPDYPTYRNNLTISFLMANRADLAEEVLKETLARWPNNRVALAHYAFVLKTHHNRLEEAVKAFQKALEGDKGPACEPRFYYHLGDALLQLNRYPEAHEIHKRGAKLGHFLSPAQRSLYNVPRLKSQPWWNVEQTPYSNLARALEKSWRDILKEGEEAQAMYEMEREGLKERGEWSQLDLFARGREVPDRCKRAPVTCSIVRSEPAAVGCRRGQVKFSAMEPGTHVRPHVGPTNCRLRMHLALSNTKDTYIRVDQETRQWQEGKVLMFDDSFEHEVWHNGTGKRLVIIVDVWHPDLTPTERRTLSAI